MSGAPITFKGQHLINLFLGLTIIFLIYLSYADHNHQIYFGQ